MAGSANRVVASERWADAENAGPGRYTTSRPRAVSLVAARQPTAPRRAFDQRLAGLARTVEIEIVPRLVLARRASPAAGTRTVDGVLPLPQDVSELAELVRASNAASAGVFVDEVRARGVSIEALYLDLLAPTARHLGELWVADLCDFTEVTLGLGRLQHVLHELGPAFMSEAEHRQHGRRALLVPMPGEQHTFGLFMVAEFFRRAGWDVWSAVATTQELVGLVRSEWFAVAGFSVSSNVSLDGLASGIRAVRKASRNRAIGILVGGPIFTLHPELVAAVGADATADDGRHATLQAESLLNLLPCRN